MIHIIDLLTFANARAITFPSSVIAAVAIISFMTIVNLTFHHHVCDFRNLRFAPSGFAMSVNCSGLPPNSAAMVLSHCPVEA